jgi:hypothetical protein
MFIRCANPNCQIPRKDYCEGRLFQFEIVSISVAASDERCEPFDEKPERKISHFWLCDSCASGMSLDLDPKKGLRLVPVKEHEPRSMPELGQLKPQLRKHC